MMIVRATAPTDIAAAQVLIRNSMAEDQGYGFVPEWHWDIEHAIEMYVDNPRHALMVARDGATIVGTCCVRTGGPQVPPHHPDLASRYADRSLVAQLGRQVTAPSSRRQGVATALVTESIDFAREMGFRVVYLHTNAMTPGALAFWHSTGATLVRDDRPDWDTDPRFHTVHFEFQLRDVSATGS